MIRLPLYLYTSPPIEATVDRTEDGVRLAFGLHPDELVGRIPDHSRVVDALILDGSEGMVAELNNAKAEIAHLEEKLEVEREYAEKLLALLKRVKDLASIEWELLPEEARALGSMLWHYADRADAPR